MSKIGEIRNEVHFKQPLLFTGIIRHRNITPTDIDMTIEYNGLAFIFFEIKHWTSTITEGQRIYLENIVDNLEKTNVIAAAVLIYHYVSSPDPVIVKNQQVYSVYTNGKWNLYEQTLITVIDFIERFENKCKNKGIKI